MLEWVLQFKKKHYLTKCRGPDYLNLPGCATDTPSEVRAFDNAVDIGVTSQKPSISGGRLQSGTEIFQPRFISEHRRCDG